MASASRRFGSLSQPLAFSADPKTSTALAMTASASMPRFYQPCRHEFTCTEHSAHCDHVSSSCYILFRARITCQFL